LDALCDSVPGGGPPPLRGENPDSGSHDPPLVVGPTRGGARSASTRAAVEPLAQSSHPRRLFTGQPRVVPALAASPDPAPPRVLLPHGSECALSVHLGGDGVAVSRLGGTCGAPSG
jgi:hypothetical protein